MTFLPESTQLLLKETHSSHKDYTVLTGMAGSSAAVNYLDGFTREAIMGHMARRYCRVIVKGTEKKNDSYPTYTADPNLAVQAAIEAGLFEVIPTNLLPRICSIVGNLGQNTSFDFIRDGETDSEFTSDISLAREDGGFGLALSRAEEVSVASGSCAVLIQILGGKLNYQVIAPDKIWFMFASKVDGRPTDTMNIDEASTVVVQLGEKKFVAYFGSCIQHPQGRMVNYTARDYFDIPPVGQGTYEHVDSAGKVANPLTVLRLESREYGWPEYPVAVWTGSAGQQGKTLLTAEASLFASCLELDLANSRLLTCANKSASGMVVFSSEEGASMVIPDNIAEGTAILQPGQSINILSLPAANATVLGDIIRDQMSYIADAYSVPAHLLAVSQTGSIPSGAALAQLAEPMNKMRSKRAFLNKANITRIFEVECALARIEHDDMSFATDIVQRWIVEDMAYAQSETERLTETAMAQQLPAGSVLSREDAIRKHVAGMENASDEEVALYIESIGETSAEPASGRLSFI